MSGKRSGRWKEGSDRLGTKYRIEARWGKAVAYARWGEGPKSEQDTGVYRKENPPITQEENIL